MRYALLIYGNTDYLSGLDDAEKQRMNAGFAEVMTRPGVSGALRLQGVDLATTVTGQGKALVTDGPYVDSKDFLGGLIFVDAGDLDGALAVATEIQELGLTRAIEIRPVNDEELVRA